MKPFYMLIVCTLPLICHAYPAKDSEGKIINLDVEEDVAELDNDPSESGKESQIQQRSSSFDYVTHLKSGLLSSLGHASASIASGSSGSSSGGGTIYKTHDSGHHGNSIVYDPWSFKKSVLNTIFQAVKAITGGVTALKGQLIKGGGLVLSASGNLVAASGDKVTDVGKTIINSANINSHPVYVQSVEVAAVHPFAKFSSLSGASSGSSSGGKPGPVVHTESITSYEIPSGHGSYGPPSKPPSYSSATHQYLPPPPSNGYSGGAPFSGGHAAFEAPSSNYLPSGYGQDGHDDFNIYGRHKKLTDEEAKNAAVQLQEILNMLPNGKSEYTASKTVQLATPTITNNLEYHDSYNKVLPTHLGSLESLSHTESITAAYGPGAPQNNPSDLYHQMSKKQRVEETYIKNHPNEGYAYESPKETYAQYNKYNNYHAANANNALHDLTPIIAALEVVKHKAPVVNQPPNTLYTIEKSVEKIPPPGATQFKYLQPVVKKSKYTYFNPAQSRVDPRSNVFSSAQSRQDQRSNSPSSAQLSSQNQHYNGPVPTEFPDSKHNVRRHLDAPQQRKYRSNSNPVFKMRDYQIQDPLLFNQLFVQ